MDRGSILAVDCALGSTFCMCPCRPMLTELLPNSLLAGGTALSGFLIPTAVTDVTPCSLVQVHWCWGFHRGGYEDASLRDVVPCGLTDCYPTANTFLLLLWRRTLLVPTKRLFLQDHTASHTTVMLSVWLDVRSWRWRKYVLRNVTLDDNSTVPVEV
jgi:hypothetical protein